MSDDVSGLMSDPKEPRKLHHTVDSLVSVTEGTRR